MNEATARIKINRLLEATAYHVPLLLLVPQQAIVEKIEAERVLITANRELVERMESKSQAAVARVWRKERSEEWLGSAVHQ